MSLSKKYGVDEAKIKAMIKDGAISACWAGREEVYRRYQEIFSKSGRKTHAVKQVADEMKCTDAYVWKVVYYFE